MFLFSILVLISLFLFTRLLNLTKLPIFTDEAIYIRWSQIGSRDANWRFISMTDGKQPMYTWIAMVFLKFIDDPLFAGRLVSVLAGAGSMVAIYLVAKELFGSRRVGLIASTLYLLSPFPLMYDRMALYDSLVSMFSLWSLYLAIRLSKSPRLDVALLLGMMLGAGMLNKTSGFISLFLLPLTLTVFDWRQKETLHRLFRWVLFTILAVILSQGMYSVLRLSPFFNMISLKDTVFVWSIAETIQYPFRFVYGNLRGLFDWLIGYFSVPLFLAALAPLFFFWKQTKEKLLLYGWWLVPFLGLAVMGKVLFPRFILFMTMPLLILAATSLHKIIESYGKKVIGVVLLVAILLPSVWTSYFIVTNPMEAPIPDPDRQQYIDDWPSGGGVLEANALFAAELIKGTVSIYTDGTFGLLPYAIEIYHVDNPNAIIKGVWPLPAQMPEDMRKDASDHPTYFILNQVQEPPPGWPLVLLSEYQKGKRKDRKLRLYRVVPYEKT